MLSYQRSVAFQLPILVSLFRNDIFLAPAAAFQIRQRHVRNFSGLSAVFRGDYAGYHSTYDIDGTHIPLPEFYVPQALLDWGQAPLAFEVVVSENEDNTRQVLTVLPETGCGLDNLEVLQRRETLGKPLWETNETIEREACVYVTHSQDTSITRLECVFALNKPHHRSRVVLNCDSMTGNVKKPISLYLERRISESSTEGRRADGGGLDARSVSGWIGPDLRAVESSLSKVCPPTYLGEIEGKLTNEFGLPGNLTFAFDNSSEKGLTIWIGQAYVDEQQSRWIELQCRNSEWVVRSWLETITCEPSLVD